MSQIAVNGVIPPKWSERISASKYLCLPFRRSVKVDRKIPEQRALKNQIVFFVSGNMFDLRSIPTPDRLRKSRSARVTSLTWIRAPLPQTEIRRQLIDVLVNVRHSVRILPRQRDDQSMPFGEFPGDAEFSAMTCDQRQQVADRFSPWTAMNSPCDDQCLRPNLAQQFRLRLGNECSKSRDALFELRRLDVYLHRNQ